ncbi:hypothetical protein SKAU_G00012560 [Synaphobranchus kaupii]|uniref:Uncharacterized protein n=1 Tax=Synaphobranchus kaupii TaxID=118154 RepID=A0A9Q1GBG2_SYNKA|nr:hypothetical protein SKAU_G00012560 [Synaphobranchus kaupii]
MQAVFVHETKKFSRGISSEYWDISVSFIVTEYRTAVLTISIGNPHSLFIWQSFSPSCWDVHSRKRAPLPCSSPPSLGH